MKNQTLSIEQMKHLKALGVDVSKASMMLLFIGEDGEHVGWEVENHGMPGAEPLYERWNEESEVWESTHKEYFDAETGSYDHSFRNDCGVFTLQDMLELMPKSMINNGIDYNLSIYGDFVSYSHFGNGNHKHDIVFIKCKYGLLDGVYQVLCWLAENGHLKGDN